jgi:hypothetical protein
MPQFQTPIDIDNVLERPEMRLLQTVRGPVGYKKFKQVLVRLVDLRGQPIGRQIRWLCNLGFLEIERNLQGVWTAMRPTPFAAYQLPAPTYDGRRQFVVTGSPTHSYRALLKATLPAAGGQAGIESWWDEQPGDPPLVPPRIRVLAPSEAAFEELLAQLPPADRPVYQCGIAADLFSQWAGDILQWNQQLQWWDRGLPNAERYWRPHDFRMVGANAGGAAGDLKLAEVGFQYAQDVKINMLGRFANGVVLGTAFVGDPSWGKWTAQHSGYNMFRQHAGLPAEPIQIPYDGGDLVLPEELFLPYMLARAVFLCSGLVPSGATPHPAYENHPVPNGPYFFVDQPYTRTCWVHSSVPQYIAETILKKVGAVPANW